MLGKFLPPHRGHQYLVDFAREYCERVTVLVCTLESDPIPGELRFRWMREMFPDQHLVHITDPLPQEPAEHPRFWDIWRGVCRRAAPDGVDVVFASEDYGHTLAQVLGAAYVPVDHGRRQVPVSGTRIRADPMGIPAPPPSPRICC